MNKFSRNISRVIGEDVENYLREMEIGFSCIEEMHDSLRDGDLEDVILCMKDLYDAVEFLQAMFAKKERKDKLTALVDDLKTKGIHIDFVSRLLKEEAASAGTLTASN